MKRIITVLLLLTCVVGFSQNNLKSQFQQLTLGKNTLPEIVETYNQFVSTVPDSYEKSKFEKHFARWAYYQSFHTNVDGKFVDVSHRTYEAIQNHNMQSKSSFGNWTFVGPTETNSIDTNATGNGIGRVDRITFHPTDPDIIYIGTPAGGLWKTTDGGTTWASLSSYIPSLGISGIVVDHSNPNRLFVLTGDGDTYNGTFVQEAGFRRESVGVMVSENGGQDWELTGQLTADSYVGFRLVQSPTNANIMLAATSDGLFKTDDFGDTWNLVNPGIHYDIEFKPGNPNSIYSSGWGEFYYSNDAGDTWNDDSQFNKALFGGRVEIAVTPDNSSRIYLFAGPQVMDNVFNGFFTSTNSGANFTRILKSPNLLGSVEYDIDQSKYDLGIAVSPTDEEMVFVAGLIIWKTEDGGQSGFSNSTSYWEGNDPWYVHPDVHDIAYNPINGNLYTATDGGFYVSTDDGSTWDDLKAGICVTQPYHIDDYNSNPDIIFIGSQDNGIKYKSQDTSYIDHIASGDGFDVVINYADHDKGYAGINEKVYRYTSISNNKRSRIALDDYFPQIEMHASDTSILYYSYEYVRKYNSDPGVSTISLGTKGFSALTTCPSNSNKIYSAGGNDSFDNNVTMWKTDQDGNSDEEISDNPGFPANYPRITDIGVRPINSNYVYATFAGYTDTTKVLYSTNSGDTWTNITYNLPNIPVNCIEVDNSNNVYIGTDIGVYFKSSGATEWVLYNNNMPNAPVSDMSINQVHNQLLAATFGRGIWKSDLNAGCETDVVVNHNVSGKFFESATNSITFTGEIYGGDSTEVVLRSENYVDLKPRTSVNSTNGNKIYVNIDDCETWIPQDCNYFPTTLLNDYKIVLSRNKGTLQVMYDSGNPTVKTRVFKSGDVKIILMDQVGNYEKEITSKKLGDGIYDFKLPSTKLKNNLYFLYLIVDGEVTHLQEYYPENSFNTISSEVDHSYLD